MKARLGIGFGQIFLIIAVSSLPPSSSEHICSVEKYVTKMYFEKHEKLIDSDFDRFVENEIPFDSGKVQEKSNMLSVVQRSIIGEGSHRRLSSSIRLEMQPESHSELTMKSCIVVFIERLPSGIFADPFELQHLVQRGVFTEAAVFGDTNLELPSFQSNRSIVEIHMNIAFKASSPNNEDLEINLEIPVHSRYQAGTNREIYNMILRFARFNVSHF